MSTYSDIAGEIVYDSESERQKTIGLLEKKATTMNPFIRDS